MDYHPAVLGILCFSFFNHFIALVLGIGFVWPDDLGIYIIRSNVSCVVIDHLCPLISNGSEVEVLLFSFR